MFSRSRSKIVDKLKEAARTSPCKYQHAAAIYQGGKCLGIATNSDCNRIGSGCTANEHAEEAVMRIVGKNRACFKQAHLQCFEQYQE